ncbi:LPXTG cell wall anchor domain-containing protein [Myceligenerans indicum]|uniref:LPXTG cell wall anchor domain-containing protein n=1 Tax=Myceligenerans indicum TaxID=2593663 RepID=A0ABS1LJL6_9MICO|nr:LPXTG cell wall anchor domain-containing protein [Myceligenerans indicum]MBL0886425.1 LPXTG cell wall anchor domain-containing protein [Myceligenerans indicum]
MRLLSAASRIAATLAVAPAVLFAAPAAATGGSDDPVPYEVTAEGLTLPPGTTFPDNGHVNIRYTVDGTENSAGIHFETLNDQPSGKYVGESFLPWGELIDAASYCITWVQVSEYNQHFGEGGQEPVCTTDEPEPTPDATEPATGPTPSASTPSAAPGTPGEAAVTPSASPEPSAEDGTVLAATGSTAVPVAIFAGLLVAAGAILVVLGRRARRG